MFRRNRSNRDHYRGRELGSLKQSMVVVSLSKEPCDLASSSEIRTPQPSFPLAAGKRPREGGIGEW